MSAKTRYNLSEKPTCVLGDGPYERDPDGGFDYTVCFGNERGEPITENSAAVWRVATCAEAERFTCELARRWHLEAVWEGDRV